FDKGVVMVVDGVGNYSSDVTEPGQLTDNVNPLARESESYYRFDGSRIETLKKVWLKPVRGFLSDEFYFMPGLGALYSRVSIYIFAHWSKCGEVMGLAPYGRPEAVKPLLEINSDEVDVPDWGVEFDQPFFPEQERDWEASPSMEHWKDVAWRVQDDAETLLLKRAIWLRETTGAKNLCMAGGVVVDWVARGRMGREAGFDNVWIQPAAGDDGIAIGCAYYGYLALLKKPRSSVMTHAYLGAPYRDEDARAAANKWLVRLQTINTASKNICRDTARLLSEGHVFAWFQGRSEFGPRALGNRSILADPRKAEMKDKLNKRVKHRQAFRPFAPVVLAERASEIFEGDEESPFMLLVKRVRPEWRGKIPAIVHADGTARGPTAPPGPKRPTLWVPQGLRCDRGPPGAAQHVTQREGRPNGGNPRRCSRMFPRHGNRLSRLARHVDCKEPISQNLLAIEGRVFGNVFGRAARFDGRGAGLTAMRVQRHHDDG